jgi:hypothetical protein
MFQQLHKEAGRICPCNSTLIEYSLADVESPDGCMMETIVQNSKTLKEMEVPEEDFHQEGNCSWESCKISIIPSSYSLHTCWILILFSRCIVINVYVECYWYLRLFPIHDTHVGTCRRVHAIGCNF